MENTVMSINQLKEEFGSNGRKLTIPYLQRDYVWTQKEHRRLFMDILQIAELVKKQQDAQHFLGEITLLRNDMSSEYEVIDGQQRLTTLTVLLDMLSDAERFGCSNNAEDSSYFSIDKIKVERNAEIMTNDVNDEKDIYCIVYNFFAQLMTENDITDAGFIKSVIEERVFVYVVYVDIINGNDAFERLNSTGEPLVFTDLILNHLISMAKEEGADMANLKQRWEDLLKSISIEEMPPENNDCSDEDEEDIADTEVNGENEESAEENTANESVDETPLKMLKIKKFFNALHCVTLPERESFPEGVDDFIRMMKRLYNSFYKDQANQVEFNTSFITSALEEWSRFYIEYTAPFNDTSGTIPRQKHYSSYLFYLRTIGNVSLIPTLMRSLYRLKQGKFNEHDVSHICHALVTSQLLRAVYTDRDNNREMDKKLRIADYIYLADFPQTQERGNYKYYYQLLCHLADIKQQKARMDQDGVFIKNNNYDNVTLWNMQYSSGLSKTILAIRNDMHSVSKVYEYELKKDDKGNKIRFEVEHMVSLKISENGKTYSEYGYNSQNVNSFWNLELLESSLNKEAGNKTPEEKCEIWEKSRFSWYFPEDLNKKDIKSSRVDLLKKLYESFKSHCFGGTNGAEFKPNDLNVVSYHKEGLNFTRISSPDNPKSGEVYSVSISKDGRYVMMPEKNDKNNEITGYYIDKTILEGKKKIECLKKLLEVLGAKYNDETQKYVINDEILKILKDISSDKEKVSNILFINNDFFKDEKNKSTSTYNRVEKNRFILNNETLYYNINTDANTFIKAARKLYNMVADKAKFKFYVEKANPEMHYVKGRRILTRLINIGDKTEYEKAVLRQAGKSNLITAEVQKSRPASKVKKPFISADTKSFADLMNYKFIIPEYQRRYVWEKAQFAALKESLKDRKPLGTIILYDQGDESYSIVDGQQRLTTLSSICEDAALINSDNNKLSNKKAVDYFKNEGLSAEMVKEVHFNVLIINNYAPETFQYKVFGTINGCGKRLTVEDKVKNFLCSIEDEKVINENLPSILQPGFIKAFTEMKVKEHIPENELYTKFKEVYSIFKEEKENAFTEIHNDSELYGLIKGNNEKWSILKNTTPELELWIKMYRLLKINTSDALLLYMFKSKLNNINSLTPFMRKLIMMYFLLYVDDPNGNSKKSINSKLPKLIKENSENTEETLINKMWGELILDNLYKGEIDKELYIYEKLCAFDLADRTPKHIARFILLLC